MTYNSKPPQNAVNRIQHDNDKDDVLMEPTFDEEKVKSQLEKITTGKEIANKQNNNIRNR